MKRRSFLRLASSAGALLAASHVAWPQAYPSRPVHLIVAFAPGGANDVVARLLAQWLTERVGQPFGVENKPGAGSNLGTEYVVRAAPDGYTLLIAGAPNAINATLYEKLNYNFISDIAPVAAIARVPNVMEVTPSLPVKTVPEFIAYAKANRGEVNMASAGVGSASHMTGELFKAMTGIDMPHVPYRGAGPALTDLMGGQVQVMFDIMPSSVEYIKAGNLRALAVTSATRSEALPDVPTVNDFVPGYEATAWFGVGAPKNTPTEIIQKLNHEINAVLLDPKFKARLADLGATTLAGSPADFGRLIADETEKWARVVKFAGVKPE